MSFIPSEKEVDEIIFACAEEKIPELKMPVSPKKKRGRKKKTLKEVAGEIMNAPEKEFKETGTQTTIEEQYENSILSEEYEVRIRYLESRMKKYKNNPERLQAYSNAMEKLLKRKII